MRDKSGLDEPKAMTDALLHPSDREEGLSRAYVRAVAASAGYVVADTDFDRDGIDLEIKAGGRMRPSLGIQLKATVNFPAAKEGTYAFSLPRRNFDLLRLETQVPRILVVLSLPRDERRWLEVSVEQLVMRHCAFWVALRAARDTGAESEITVYIPESNLFAPDGLRALMEKSRAGEEI